ncbi:MAG: nuclear transport factor 2 family protein [Pseudonocardia sp.]
MTTLTSTNAATVVAIYEAFARGDLAAIPDALAEDVTWEDWADNTAQNAGVAHMQRRRGPAEVAEFFALLAEWTPEEFAVLDVIGTGRQVVAEVRAGFTLPNGGRFVEEELHLWTFDDTGKVVRFRHYLDTAKHIAAARGEDTVGG